MARPVRLELAGGLYHVTSRGDRREDIYTDDEGRLNITKGNTGIKKQPSTMHTYLSVE